MIDQLNIRVENPEVVLYQKEDKKLLKGKTDDKVCLGVDVFKSGGRYTNIFLVFSKISRPNICTAPQYSFFAEAKELDWIDRT